MPRVRSPTHHIPILSPANSHTKTRELPGETASPRRLALTPLSLALGLPRQTKGRGVASLATQGRARTTGSSQFPERLALEETAPTTSTRTRSLSCLGGALGLPELEARALEGSLRPEDTNEVEGAEDELEIRVGSLAALFLWS